ncbi:MAG: hypothetical protein ACP5GZ_12035, partial [Vulcanisaeta sp.]|uniref:hypothetical protein n=1 Tax=Vulcanisaeta sp. TaxID=2020871 RepID=UPI003D0C018C
PVLIEPRRNHGQWREGDYARLDKSLFHGNYRCNAWFVAVVGYGKLSNQRFIHYVLQTSRPAEGGF